MYEMMRQAEEAQAAAVAAATAAQEATEAKAEAEKLISEATALMGAAEQETDVTLARLLVCLESASHWADEMPKYAAREKRSGNRWAIASGSLAALTGLAVWPLLTDQVPPLVAAAIVSLIAFVSAMCALVLKVNRYTEMSERGQELAGLYGQALGKLLDLTVADGAIDQQKAHATVAEFQQAKVRKDKLDRNPPRGWKGAPERPDFTARLQEARRIVAAARELQDATKSLR
jgi:hypothetical protein